VGRFVRSGGCLRGQPMPTANTKRIAWFMQLRRFFPLQKHHLAPRHGRFPHHKPPSDDPTSSQSETVGFDGASIVPASVNRNIAPGIQRPRVAIRPITDPAIPPAHMRVLSTMMVLAQIRTHNVSWAARAIKGLGIHAQRVFSSRVDRSEYSNAPGRRRPSNDIPNRGPIPQSSPSVAGSLPSSIPVSAWASYLPMAKSSNRSAGVSGLVRAAPPPPEGEADARPFPFDDRQPHPEARDNVSDHDSYPRKASSAATIHIDGSALGRWAIQHLERALGKPTTGMTGVDPRATLPRSRVSPF